MELAESIEESMDDMTAAEIAPKAKNETAAGVRYWTAAGRITLGLA